MMRVRLDSLVVERGLAQSRERAKALIMSGQVLVKGAPASKAGAMVEPDAEVALRGEDIPYVSRGGLKLAAALEHFRIDLAGAVAMDIGASTGGFTDCMLQRGAVRVYAIDVGYGQMDWKLRTDKRVVLMERTNIRYLEGLPEPVDFAAIDVSFISLGLVLPKVLELLKKQSLGIVALVKPQFEVGKGEVGKGGIVRDEAKRLAAVEDVSEAAKGMGLRVEGSMESPITGAKGNVEYLLYLRESG